jgi:ABC-type transport system involved in multi-copper enzyme maturation permease subunit
MIAAFARFDLGTLATTQARRVLIPVFFIVIVGLFLPVPGAAIVVGAVVAAASISYPFQADERGSLDTLYLTSSVSRREVVIGRYATILVMSAVYVALGAVVSIVAGVVQQHPLGWPLASFMLLIAFGVVVVCVVVQLPWFFALGFTRARPMIYLPLAALSIAGFIAGQAGLLDGVSSLSLPAAPNAEVSAGILAAGIALVVVSVSVASNRYQRRRF